MKTLLAIRHAKSSWKDPALTDLQRPLKKRGCHHALEMAGRLKVVGVTPDRILTSPANRAVQTVEHMLPVLEVPGERVEMVSDLYTFDYAELIRYLRQLPDGLQSVMLVGHNPAITDLVNFLALEALPTIPTCGAALLEMDASTWQSVRAGGARLVHYDFPGNRDLDQ